MGCLAMIFRVMAEAVIFKVFGTLANRLVGDHLVELLNKLLGRTGIVCKRN